MNSINPKNFYPAKFRQNSEADLTGAKNTKYFLLTIDVEDWFQVENFRQWNPHSSWDSRELRVERNVYKLLDLFDSIELKSGGSLKGSCTEKVGRYEGKRVGEPKKADGTEHSCYKDLKAGTGAVEKWGNLGNQAPAQPVNNSQHTTYNARSETAHKQQPPSFPASQLQASVTELPCLPASPPQAERRPKATFFVLGWLAERLPHLVREIRSRGHEIASHGYNHELPNSLSSPDLKDDLSKSKKLLEDITGGAVTGYRAPSFAINDDILETIGDCGYQYDSSYNSFSLHGRYGKISLNGSGRRGIAHRINENFYEPPISNLNLKGKVVPFGGGAYFRLYPFFLFNFVVKSILKRNSAYIFYMHPWEIDSEQPRVQDASMGFKFRHYSNLSKTQDKLKNLIGSFSQCRFTTCSQYLSYFVRLSATI